MEWVEAQEGVKGVEDEWDVAKVCVVCKVSTLFTSDFVADKVERGCGFDRCYLKYLVKPLFYFNGPLRSKIRYM